MGHWSATKWSILSLIGKLHFVCHVCRPSRAFLCCMIETSTKALTSITELIWTRSSVKTLIGGCSVCPHGMESAFYMNCTGSPAWNVKFSLMPGTLALAATFRVTSVRVNSQPPASGTNSWASTGESCTPSPWHYSSGGINSKARGSQYTVTIHPSFKLWPRAPQRASLWWSWSTHWTCLACRIILTSICSTFLRLTMG